MISSVTGMRMSRHWHKLSWIAGSSVTAMASLLRKPMMRWHCILCIRAVSVSACHGQMNKRAMCQVDGTLQRIYDDGTTRQQPREPLQVECRDATIADKNTVGWSVLMGNRLHFVSNTPFGSCLTQWEKEDLLGRSDGLGMAVR